MTAISSRAGGAWYAVLAQVENTIAESLRDVERQEALVAGDPVTGLARMDRVQNRLNERIKKLADRVAEAERSAEIVGAELASAEAELRDWVAQIGGIAKQIEVIQQ